MPLCDILTPKCNARRVCAQTHKISGRRPAVDPSVTASSWRLVNTTTVAAIMPVCVACQKPLEVEVELEEEDEDAQMGASSSKAPAAQPETVPDDVHLNCGCHFHWYEHALLQKP